MKRGEGTEEIRDGASMTQKTTPNEAKREGDVRRSAWCFSCVEIRMSVRRSLRPVVSRHQEERTRLRERKTPLGFRLFSYFKGGLEAEDFTEPIEL